MFVLAVFALPLPASAAPEKLLLELPGGKVVIRLMPDIAPKHVEQVKTLTQQGFYDGLAWFRVIDGFIAQTGYPKGSRGKSSLPDLPAEFSRYTFRRGTVGMGARGRPEFRQLAVFHLPYRCGLQRPDGAIHGVGGMWKAAWTRSMR
jgi:peptidylprolyl isomerase